MAEPIRREILGLVRDRERTVSDIAEHFEVSRPAVSQHLRVLSEADLVTVRSEGTRRFYSARPEGLAELREWMSGFWESSLANLETEIARDKWNEQKKKKGRRT